MGAAIVIIGVALMIIIHEGAHFAAAKSFNMKATQAFFGFGPTLWSVTRGETEYGVKAVPLGGYVRIIGMNPFEEVDPADEGRTYREAPFWKKSVVVLAGIFSHFVVAFLIFYGLAIGYGVHRTEPVVSAVSETVPETNEPAPAAASGVRPGDRIVAVGDVAVAEWADFAEAVAAQPGEVVVIEVERDGSVVPLTTTLAAVERSGGTIGFFGISPARITEFPGPIRAIGVAFDDVTSATVESVRGLWALVANFPGIIAAAFGQGEEILDEVRPVSPIGLVQIAGPVERSLALLALVNVFVGILNLVPLYPLDGGHFAVALYEKVFGRTPDVRKLMPVAAAVVIFIVSLGILGVYFDFVRPLQL